jgi:hypothetical protein
MAEERDTGTPPLIRERADDPPNGVTILEPGGLVHMDQQVTAALLMQSGRA